jgi:KDO2-lipid IV(A) lauroyltransferase
VSSAGERLADLGYAAGWSVVRRLPEGVARTVFDRVGEYVGGRGGGPVQLRKNLSRVLGCAPEQVSDDLMRDAVRSYARYWREAFRLPTMDFGVAASRVDLPPPDRRLLDAALAQGTGVVLALPHSGNWDMAGVWLVQNIGTFSTVAERLKPDSLFERFVRYRETLGFEIFPLSGGEQPPYGQLAARLRDGGVVCLLGERDLAKHGVPVSFFGERTRMPAGPAKLAIDTGAALVAVHHWYTGPDTSRLRLSGPLDTSGGVAAATQLLATEFETNIAAHPEDWHMLQPLWEADWSDERRERIERMGAEGDEGIAG